MCNVCYTNKPRSSDVRCVRCVLVFSYVRLYALRCAHKSSKYIVYRVNPSQSICDRHTHTHISQRLMLDVSRGTHTHIHTPPHIILELELRRQRSPSCKGYVYSTTVHTASMRAATLCSPQTTQVGSGLRRYDAQLTHRIIRSLRHYRKRPLAPGARQQHRDIL